MARRAAYNEPSVVNDQPLQAEWSDLERHALEGLITETFRKGMLSSHEVGQTLCLQSRWEVIAFLSERGAYPGYDLEDIEEDRRTLKKSGKAEGPMIVVSDASKFLR
jgi:hypothetical protein